MTRAPLQNDFDVAVVGGGPAGTAAAIALADAGVRTALLSRRPARFDNRTTALMRGSVNALQRLGVFAYCAAEAAPLAGIRLIDDTGRLLRGPELLFMADEIGHDAFGYNIENWHLLAALDRRAAELPTLERIEQAAQSVEPGPDGVTLDLEDGRRLCARLVIGADGRASLCRTAAGILVSRSQYPQAALTLNLSHSRPHDDVSTEFHTPSGPFTLVPLRGLRSSLVCVVTPREAERLAALETDALSIEIETRSHSILGRVTVEPGCAVFRLGVETARRFAAQRIALVGEAAHVFPPIGAQGLNLGLRDAATIAEIAVHAVRSGADPGSEQLLDRYDDLRRPDVISRTVAIDLLNRTLLSDFLPVQGLRGAGLHLLHMLAPLRRAVMREGVMPRLSEPRLMRGEAL